ncbi:MAG TPA: TMEM175 family protein, partial [Streptosporangiaceae bacterium]
PGHARLALQLGQRWPAFVTYLISFFTIGIIWVNHHAVLSTVRVATRSLLFINLALLAVTVTIPFATATLADYLAKGGWNASVAAALYAGVFEVMSISFALLYEWTLRHDEYVIDPLPGPAKNAARLRFYFGQVPYLAAFAVAFVSAPATVIITGVVAIYYVVVPARPGREPPQPGTAGPTAE